MICLSHSYPAMDDLQTIAVRVRTIKGWVLGSNGERHTHITQFDKPLSDAGLCRSYTCMGVNVDEHHRSDLVQQLMSELRWKKMIFPKNCIQLSKVIGQGTYVI